MRCTIASTGLKSWGRAIHALASIGDNDINFEFTAESLTLTTFDSSLSVCATMTFERDFFMSYEILGDKLSCRVPSKCILKPFRSTRFITKPVSMCEIIFSETEADKLEINIKCISGCTIKYQILLTTNADRLQVDFDVSLLKNCINADSKLLLACLGNFSHNKGVSNLTLKVSENKVLFKNSTTDLTRKETSVHTEVMLNKVEFNEFVLELETELTFPMREFKTFVSFAETMKLSVSINFHDPNQPVIVTVNGDDNYQASLTLATSLMNENASTSPLQSHPAPPKKLTGSSVSITTSTTMSSHRTITEMVSNPVRVRGPPHKKLKTLFPNLGNAFEAALDIPGHDVVLFGNSDDENEYSDDE